MTKEELKSLSKEEVMDFIRKRLVFKDDVQSQLRTVKGEDLSKEHRRFEMSGYEGKTGECTLHNLAIVNEFADLGIYDYTSYLFLDFYKGCGTLHYQYFGDSSNQEEDLGGGGTTEIVYIIFEKTILSDMSTRRRA
jgi:hypothetical protein